MNDNENAEYKRLHDSIERAGWDIGKELINDKYLLNLYEEVRQALRL
ncbi:hypothetical protein CPJCM30710_25110 [Clostridium polyendosporum]|uniref:Uncharacterized protein n=1 Tax=Clostridium polyendosporum TaxID=69208 RepID=A0A919S257_9CLOT|nr:hypothetical protein [Clostridium polyendosporum]GIM29845.1 hypothetical protein CPJCM30710_25110 [Clostridium polyendosporum]